MKLHWHFKPNNSIYCPSSQHLMWKLSSCANMRTGDLILLKKEILSKSFPINNGFFIEKRPILNLCFHSKMTKRSIHFRDSKANC